MNNNPEYISYSVEIAIQYGIIKAVILAVLQTQINACRLANVNYYDGRYWVKKSFEDLCSELPYFKPTTVRDSLSELVKDNLLLVGYYNDETFDRTRWYSIASER